MLERLPRWLRPWLERETATCISLRDRSTLLFLAAAAVWFIISYFHCPESPSIGGNQPSGWLGWADQMHYLDGSRNLAHGELKPNKYFVGYELLAAPFCLLFPRHAFFIPDLLLVVVMAGAFFASCRHCMSRMEAWLLAAFAFNFEGTLRDKCLAIPWNTLPAYAAIFLVAYLVVFAPRTLPRFILAACATAVALLARPNELVALAPLYVFAAFSWQDVRKWQALAWFGAGVAVPAGILVAIDFYLYRTPGSPYSGNETHHFGFARLGLKFYQLFCDGTFLTGNSLPPEGAPPRQILERFPFFLLIVPGALALLRRRGIAAAGLGLALLLTLLVYLSFNPVNSPSYSWIYGAYHYYWWIIPWLILLVYLSFREAPRIFSRPVWLAALLLPAALFAVIGFQAVEVATTDDRALTFTTNYANRTSIINITATHDIGTIEDVRLVFQKPPDGNASTVATASKMNVFLNGRPLMDRGEYMPSQQGTRTIDLSVLFQAFRVRAGDTLRITMSDTSEPVLQRAALLKVVFSPGAAVRHLLTP